MIERNKKVGEARKVFCAKPENAEALKEKGKKHSKKIKGHTKETCKGVLKHSEWAKSDAAKESYKRMAETNRGKTKDTHEGTARPAQKMKEYWAK
ncbi:MAG: hypothetical protein QXN55_01240 [Candidatus Nitrosotenuis sp.]